jgi:ATP-binding cassette subfamily B protein
MTHQEKEKKPPVWPVVGRLFQFSGRARGWLYLAVAFDLLLAAQLIISNDFMRRMFDKAMSHNAEGFWLYFWLSIGLGLLSWPSNYMKTYGLGRFSENVLYHLRSAVADKSRKLPVAYMEARHSGDMLSVLNADLGKLKNLFQNDLLNLMGNTIRGIAAFGYMLSVDWLLTLVATIFTPVIFIVIQSLTNPVTKKGEEVQEEIGQVNSVAKDGR